MLLQIGKTVAFRSLADFSIYLLYLGSSMKKSLSFQPFPKRRSVPQYNPITARLVSKGQRPGAAGKKRVRFSQSSPQIFGSLDSSDRNSRTSDDNNNRSGSVNERPNQPPRSTSVISMAR